MPSALGCVQTISVIGPVFGYLLGSLCAKIYVDIGFVNMGEWNSDVLFPKGVIEFSYIWMTCTFPEMYGTIFQVKVFLNIKSKK